MIRDALGRSFIRELPAPVAVTLGAGQPILMSITSGAFSRDILAASAMVSGSPPKSCTAMGRSASVISSSFAEFLLW